MSKLETYKCDVCGKLKQDTNHWFRGSVVRSGGVIIEPWDSTATSDVDLCGEECAVKWMHRALAKEATL